ncbi:hypothetical protein [uncultured Thiodictyon sp.]|uniref:hypothetical protein n=1 Tax=uncultured Thiodictyon sp. TaxID=1846217 RepID=UPI0025DF61EF|nr:hypothetical protein [uncultured Thiodictyon sp.]
MLERPEQWQDFRQNAGQATLVLRACADLGSEHKQTLRRGVQTRTVCTPGAT